VNGPLVSTIAFVVTEGANVRVRIGIGDTSREIELDVDDGDALVAEIEDAFGGENAILWFTDVGNRRIGVPVQRIAYVELEPEQRVSVGFTSS
jgi:hypothetical protein